MEMGASIDKIQSTANRLATCLASHGVIKKALMRAHIFQVLLLPILALSGCNKPERALKNESAAPSAQATKPSGAPPAGMVLIPAGSFLMGENEETRPHDGPIHKVSLNAFYMDETEVTNQQFQAFIDATHYQTMAALKGALAPLAKR